MTEAAGSGGGTTRRNRLATATSPYLLQHADNPVDWYPWGEQAFRKAREESKIIFLSSGYSTCHWCHVMAHESFEDDTVADILNTHFVCCKVDKEERPDVDGVYMSFVQATSGRGGWPMSVFLTPDLVPIVGATYFPRGQFISLLSQINTKWTEEREKLEAESDNVLTALKEFAVVPRAEEQPKLTEAIVKGFQTGRQSYDQEHGGFGSSPKFPRGYFLEFLLQYSAMAPSKDDAGEARKLVLATLKKIVRGGVNDQLGGGFHRYSVDQFWHVPHYEKMLYDQSQLTQVLLSSWLVSHDIEYRDAVVATLDYVKGKMVDAEVAGFLSAEDADSKTSSSPNAKTAEGAFYVWTTEECRELLGEQFPLIAVLYGLKDEGNSPPRSDPHGELKGKNTLKIFHDTKELASKFGKNEDDVVATVAKAKHVLLKARSSRPRPHLDDKIVTSWNGLMTSAFVRAAKVLHRDDYLTQAIRVGEFFATTMTQRSKSGLATLFRACRLGSPSVDAFAHDYSATISSFLDLYTATGSIRWLKLAVDLQETLDAEFWDTKGGGYFVSREGASDLILRRKEDHDGDEPSASSLGALNCARLACITGRDEYWRRAEEIVDAFAQILGKYPNAMPVLLQAAARLVAGKLRVVVCGKRGEAITEELLLTYWKLYCPMVTLVPVLEDEDVAFLPKETLDMVSGASTGTAFVCTASECLAPTSDPRQLESLITTLLGPKLA